MIERLGPIYIKFGQVLSTRRDLLPSTYAQELAKLQNKVPPFDSATAVQIVEDNLGKSIDDVFKSFTREPIASASLAQVHAAVLHNRHEVVVKVIRPNIERIIQKDIVLMLKVAGILERLSSDARRLHLVQIVRDYRHTVLGELDLELEAQNTQTIRRNFADSPLLYAPRVYRHLSTKDVLVMEHIHAIPVSDTSTLKARGTDMKKLAERGVETFFTQLFVHNFFHADMHPGNVLVDISDPSEPRYVAIDCAIIGQLSEKDQTYLARNVLAFLNRDYHEIARLHAESGWIGAHVDVNEFENVIRNICDPIFQKPLAEISFGNFLLSLFNAAREFRMEVQPQLVLLQKTLLSIEGLGRQLYPDLNLWETAKPFMQQWMEQHFGFQTTIKEFLDNLPELVLHMQTVPSLVINTEPRLSALERNQQRLSTELDALQSQSKRRTFAHITFGVACVLLLAINLPLLWLGFDDWRQSGQLNYQFAIGVSSLLVVFLLWQSRR